MLDLEEGTILYMTPFYFRNGNAAKPKYFIVILNEDDKRIIASLPTRGDFIPSSHVVSDGCIEIPSAQFNCFVFSPSTIVTTCKKSFDFPTHVYGANIEVYTEAFLNDIYRNEGVDYVIWGKMNQDLFDDLIACLKKSKAVKKKHLKMLGVKDC